MSKRMEQLKADLTRSRQRLNNVLDQVHDRWETQVYSDGAAWTVRQLGIHLALADKGQTAQVMGIARGEELIPADFDLERYNRRSVEKRAEMTVEEIRQSLQASRNELLQWLATIDDSVLDKRGRHSTLQVLSIAEILDVMATHELTHANDIARVLNIETDAASVHKD